MSKAELIAEVVGLDSAFFAEGSEQLNRLKWWSEEAIDDLALILRAAKKGENHVVLPQRPESLSLSRRDTATVVRIDPSGRMAENGKFALEFAGTKYKASGKPEAGKIVLERVKSSDPERETVVASWLGEGHYILAKGSVGRIPAKAKYLIRTGGEYEFDKAEVDFGRLSGSISHTPEDNDVLTIPSQGPATYRFNGDHRSPLQIPADGSAEAEVHPLPFQHLISVLRDDGKEAVQVKVGERYVIQEQGVGSHNKRTPYDFKVRPTVAIPEIPPTGALEIDLDPVDIDALDRIAISLLELAPEEILPT